MTGGAGAGGATGSACGGASTTIGGATGIGAGGASADSDVWVNSAREEKEF